MHDHAINKQVFEFTCSNEAIAKNIQNEFVHYASVQINGLISDILSEYARDNHAVIIPEIEIDLGDVSAETFGDEEMLGKFRTILSEKIAGIQNRNSTATAEDSSLSSSDANLELTKAFILHGDVPWWINKDAATDADAILEKLLIANPHGVKLFLESVRGNTNALLRIATQYKPATKAMLYSLASGVQQDFITAILEEYSNKSSVSIADILSFEGTARLFVPGLHTPATTEDGKTRLIRRLLTNIDPGRIKNTARFHFFAAGETETIAALVKAGIGKKRYPKNKLVKIFRKLSVAQLEFLDHYMSESDELDAVLDKELPLSAEVHAYQAADAATHDGITASSHHVSKDTDKPAQRQATAPPYLPAENRLDSSDQLFNKTPSGVTEKSARHPDQGMQAYLHADKKGNLENIEASPEMGTGDQRIALSNKEDIQQTETAAFSASGNTAIGQVDKDTPIQTNISAVQAEQTFEQPAQDTPVHTAPAAGNADKGDAVLHSSLSEAVQESNDRSAQGNSSASLPATIATPETNDNVHTISPGSANDAVQKDNQGSGGSDPAATMPDVKNTPLADLLSRTSVNEDVQAGNALSDRNHMTASASVTVSSGTGSTANSRLVASPGSVNDAHQAESRNRSDAATSASAAVSSGTDKAGTVFPDSANDANQSSKEALKKSRQTAFIMNGLHSSNPELFNYLQSLSATQLSELKRNFVYHTQRNAEHRKKVISLLQHPYLLQYNLLQIFATLSFPVTAGATPLSESHGSNPGKQKKNRLSDVIKNGSTAQSLFVTVLKNLPLKETIILQDIFQKKTFDSSSEKSLVRKILSHAPESAVLLMHFMTGLTEAELAQLQPSEKRPLPAGDWFQEENAAYEDDKTKKFYINNAGLCLIAPYLSGLFNELGYIENRIFKNKMVRIRALSVLQYMATGRLSHPEYVLQFNKLLCGLYPQQSIALQIRLTKKEKAEADSLVESVIANWKVLKNTTVQGFRESFLQRKGILFQNESSWTLQVEKKGHDLLLGTIPWGFNMIKLPWMKKMIRVEW